MHKLFFLLTGILSLNISFAQKLNNPFGYAFSISIQPGAQPVDENGIPMNLKIHKERFVYLLIPGKNKPIIKTVSYNKTAVKWDLLPTDERAYTPIAENTQKSMIIKPFMGGSMWRINIQENEFHPIPTKAVPVIIRGTIGHKSFTVNISRETGVQGYDSY